MELLMMPLTNNLQIPSDFFKRRSRAWVLERNHQKGIMTRYINLQLLAPVVKNQ